MTPIGSLQARWVLVTGAASGIGLAVAHACARRGAHLVISDINAAALEAAADSLRNYGGRCLIRVLNVSDREAVERCAADLESEGVVPDVLVNNAGVVYLGGTLQTPVWQWQRVFEVNVFGVVHMTQAFLPAMLRSGGVRRIVNMASTAAYLPAPNMCAYAASKGAVKQLSEVLAMELKDSDVGVQCIFPGIINTPIVADLRTVGSNIDAEQLAKLQTYYATQGCSPSRVGEDVVRAILTGSRHVYSGPMARLGHWLVRLSPRLARFVTLIASRQSGYLPTRQGA